MFTDYLNSFKNNLLLSLTLMADSDAAESMPDKEKVDEKIKISRNRKIPIVKFILLLVAIIITIAVWEHFM